MTKVSFPYMYFWKYNIEITNEIIDYCENGLKTMNNFYYHMKHHSLYYVSFTTTMILAIIYRKPIITQLLWHPWNGHCRYVRLKKWFQLENENENVSKQFKNILKRFLSEKSLIYASSDSIQILCDIVKYMKVYPVWEIYWCCFFHSFLTQLRQSQLPNDSKLWELAYSLLDWETTGLLSRNEKEKRRIYQDFYDFSYDDCMNLYTERSRRLYLSLHLLEFI